MVIILFTFSEGYKRPLSFFLLYSFTSLLVIVQIVYTNKKITILSNIILLSLIIVLSQYLLFPSLIGTDPWYHQNLTQIIFNQNKLPSPDEYRYSYFPAFHVINSLNMVISNLGYKTSVIFSIMFPTIVTLVLIIYKLGTKLINYKVGLIAAFLLINSNLFIQFTLISRPNSLAIVFVLILAYMIVYLKKNKNTNIFIIFMMMWTLILTHHLTSIVFAFFLLLLVLITLFILKEEIRETLLVCFIYFVSLIMYWSLFASITLSEFITILFEGGDLGRFESSQGAHQYYMGIPIIERMFINLGLFLFFSLALFGFFYMISKKSNKKGFIYSITSISVLSGGFLMLILGRELLQQRWWYISMSLMSIHASVPIFWILKDSILRDVRTITTVRMVKIVKMGMIFFILWMFIIISIMTPMANHDNAIFSPNYTRREALTEEESTSISSIEEISKKSIYTDQYYFQVESYSTDKIRDASLCFSNRNFSHCDNGVIVIRKEINENAFKLYGSSYKLNYSLYQELENQQINLIYSSGEVKAYSN